MKICLGGTFSIIHEGHEALLKKACEVGDKITIGVTTDDAAKKMGKSVVCYGERRQKLEKFLMEKFGRTADIVPLNNLYGPATYDDFDAIVVSPETVKGAEEINKIRKERGLNELKIIVVPFVLADDGIPVSSSRIQRGEVEGKRRVKVLRVKIHSSDEEEISGAIGAFKKLLPGTEIQFGGNVHDADYVVEFESGKCTIKDIAGYTTIGKTAEESLLTRLNH